MSGRPRRTGGARQYPRTARVNEILREVLAESLERMADLDERLGLLTITAVSCDPDLRHATVWLASLSEDEAEALEDLRIRLQAEMSRQVRLKRTPQLTFQADPAVAAGSRIEDILSDIHRDEHDRDLGRQERDLGRQERDLGRQERDLGGHERHRGGHERDRGGQSPTER